jgi:hypothetical protein
MNARIKSAGFRLGLVVVVLGLLILFTGPLIPYKRVDHWTCPVSGSTRTLTTWLGCIHREVVVPSVLESWILRREPGFRPQWKFASTQTHYVMGFSCGTSGQPPIFMLRPILDRVVQDSTDEQLSSLVSTLKNGTVEQQRRAVQEAADRIFSQY